LVLALGKNTPVFPFLFDHVPTFDLFQAPARWLAVTTVALAALASWAAQCWPAGRLRQRRGALGIVFGGALIVAGLAAPHMVVNAWMDVFGVATVRLGVSLVLLGGVILVWRKAIWWRVTVIAFLMFDLLFFGWPLVPTVDRSLYHRKTQSAGFLQQETGFVRVYWPTDPTHRAREYDRENEVKFDYLLFGDFGPREASVWMHMREAQLPNANMLDGVASANNFDPLLVGRYVDLLRTTMHAPALLQVMGVTHVMSDQPWHGAEPVCSDAGVTLYRLTDVPGRAWIVPNVRHVLSEKMPTVLSAPDFDPTLDVLLEQKSLSDVRPPVSRHVDARVLSLQDGPNRVTIRAALGDPGYLVLADTWYPGWRAQVDGEPVELLRANYTFRAVQLDAGEHTVEMIYRPVSVAIGAVSSLVATVLLAAGWVSALLRRVRK
jgi:hypothetical protein